MSSLQLPPLFVALDPSLLGHPLWQSSITYMPSHKPFPWPTFTSKYQVTSVSLCSTSSWKMELGLLSLLLIMCFPPDTPVGVLSPAFHYNRICQSHQGTPLTKPTDHFCYFTWPQFLSYVTQLTILSLKCVTFLSSLWHQVAWIFLWS